jgi:hypothetical protein
MNAIQFTAVVGADGAIHPPAGVTLPAGEVKVSVQPGTGSEQATEQLPLTYAWLLELAKEAKADPALQDLPSDMAENHDHYAHGAPKR